MAREQITSKTLISRLQAAEHLSAVANQASSRARRVDDIDAHRQAIEAHRRANVAWTKLHRHAIDANAEKPLQRSTYDRYARHFDKLREHWQACWDLGTRRGLSFPQGAPCGRTSDYLARSGKS